ncbi:class I lanthipeptide [Flavobacterium sp.]|uniref:class I lanthipeptide n=1 Tax=Flavobacterium sp. TaxID=239 RepID=UPI00286D7C23|nr:class I lanthipeptide [Flavobacterium sp.]
MKKQIKKDKLTFNKAAVTELNISELTEINGGTTIIGGETCTGCCCLKISITIDQNQLM